MNNDEQRTIRDEQQSVNNDEQRMNSRERLRTDGGPERCVRCGNGTKTGQIARFPALPPADGSDDLCLSCFGERVAGETALSKPQAVVLGADHIGYPAHTIAEFVAYPESGVRDLRSAAVDKLEAGGVDAAWHELFAEMNVDLPKAAEP